MSESRYPSKKDIARLSAYVDGELSAREREQVELLLEKEPGFRQYLRELQMTRTLVSSLPEVKPPHSFTLTPEMAGVRERRRAYPALQLATAFAAIAFLITVGFDALLSGSFALGAMAPAYREAAEPAVSELQELQSRAMENAVEGDAELPMEAPAMAPEQEGFFADELSESMATPAATTLPPDALAEKAAGAEIAESESMEEAAPAEELPVAPEAELDLGDVRTEDEELPEELETTAVPTEEPAIISPLEPETEQFFDRPVEAAPRIPSIRIVEIALGVILIVLIGLTLQYRKR